MCSVYHLGELRVQTLAGASQTAKYISRMIYPVIAYVFVDFIQTQPLAIISSEDEDGMVWTSILCSQPGFMKVIDERTLQINALPDDADPLCKSVLDNRELGLLLIDFSTQRRLRLNGKVVMGLNGLTVQTGQVYANCSRYIQSRVCELSQDIAISERATSHSTSLNTEHTQWISKADTFFLGSSHPLGGADASHRGGFPGFVQVVDEQTLMWPDYHGNGMFNSLGNIVENNNIGLLFLDFEQGATLQLSGTAKIIWNQERITPFFGAERVIEFKIVKVIETKNATAHKWKFVDYSPDNPWF